MGRKTELFGEYERELLEETLGCFERAIGPSWKGWV